MKEDKPRILAVDDNRDALYALERILVHHGYEVQTAGSGAEAIIAAREHRPSLVLLDVMMPQMDGYQVTRTFKQDEELKYVPLFLLTAKSSLEDVVRGLDQGADGYITKPFHPEELLSRIRSALRLRGLYEELRSTKEENESLRKAVSSRYDYRNIIGESAGMKGVFRLLEKVSEAESPVLITGASGTGKELIARAIHFNSARKSGPFVAKNCAAFSEHLLESELFGHVKGAFTGAVKDKKGLFEAADKGTLFLDEIGEMSPVLQAKLLRVLQEGCFTPVGSVTERHADTRVVAATNRDLEEMVSKGGFREDLYYRLNVININLPPLSERREDIALLVRHFLEQRAHERGQQVKEISTEVMEMLCAYSWRGNVRELENEVERLLILAGSEGEITVELLSSRIVEDFRRGAGGANQGEQGSLHSAMESLERQMILDALERSKGNKSSAAKALGISRSNLISKVQQYGLDR